MSDEKDEIRAIALSDANFCRVFELPSEYTSGFRFGGPCDVRFKMHDWFNPLPPYEESNFLSWAAWEESLVKFVRCKQYIQPGRQYLILCDWGRAIVFSTEGDE